LEQLRALAAGFDIGVALLNEPAPSGIDTPADLAAAELRWRDLAEVSR
jgi:CMP-2-keto-3-deoxyoctulosonic acid synthetase